MQVGFGKHSATFEDKACPGGRCAMGKDLVKIKGFSKLVCLLEKETQWKIISMIWLMIPSAI
jgi:hypothetical protein